MLAALLTVKWTLLQSFKREEILCVSLQTSAVLTKEYNVLRNSEELIDTTECVML